MTEDEIHDLIGKIYSQPDGAVGGPLHIVLDDGNTEDSHIRFCLSLEVMSEFEPETQRLARSCGEALLKFGDEDARGDLIDRYWNDYVKAMRSPRTVCTETYPGTQVMCSEDGEPGHLHRAVMEPGAEVWNEDRTKGMFFPVGGVLTWFDGVSVDLSVGGHESC